MQIASIDLVLVHGLADSVGRDEPHRNLLASSPCVVSGWLPSRYGHRLPRELARESFFSLRNHWPTISDRWRRVPDLKRAHDPRQPALGLAIRAHGSRHRVFARVAVFQTMAALSHRPCRYSFPPNPRVSANLAKWVSLSEIAGKAS